MRPQTQTSSQAGFPRDVDLLTATIQDLQGHLRKGTLTSVQLVAEYIRRIEENNQQGLELRAVIEIAPKDKLLDIAQQFDDLRKQGVSKGELHGIPILVKDSIATDPALGMQTTAGCLALVDSVVPRDATVIANLRAQGAIILGKTNLTELSTFRSDVPNGYSQRGGQCQSAYVAGLDPSGCSSGSAVAVSAGFAPAAVGAEVYGGLVMPASRNACFAIKPTMGIVSQTGLIPCALSMDSIGPLAKSAYDAALLLTCMAGKDEKDVSTHGPVAQDYTRFTNKPFATFKDKKLGVPRSHMFDGGIWGAWGNDAKLIKQVQEAFDQAIKKMESLGASIIDPANVTSLEAMEGNTTTRLWGQHEFKENFEAYLQSLKSSNVRTLKDVVEFNKNHVDKDATEHGSQEKLAAALRGGGTKSKAYEAAIAQGELLSAEHGVDKLLDDLKVDALVAPVNYRMARYAALDGTPLVIVPLGVYDNGAPFGLCFVGRSGSESILIALMAAFEEGFSPRPLPSRIQSSD
ncbi:hypothetical protein QFC21_002755 [Naganishia friedmannii]|uniref:Uncharacterized protein n=1 Tax=Naganishia friedmannii TaxID=89922 RepID=A0ACC2VSG2_9TREE|nr:hypothetical protein QFC21_002755 [Naganishia friedmannii]